MGQTFDTAGHARQDMRMRCDTAGHARGSDTAGHANVCSKRAPWAKPTARMSKGYGSDTYPTVVDRSVNMQ
ncbi:MAG: hypothetical protein ACI3ZB_00005 [Prevotella sp.]